MGTTIEDLAAKTDKGWNLIDWDVPELRELLRNGSMWSAASRAVIDRNPKALSLWLNVLNHRNPKQPVWDLLNKFGERYGSFSHTGTFAVETLCCAVLASAPWAASRNELVRRGLDYDMPVSPESASETAVDHAYREFVDRLRMQAAERLKPKAVRTLLDSPWPQIVKQELSRRVSEAERRFSEQKKGWPPTLSPSWAWDAICLFWGFQRVACCRSVVVAGFGKPASHREQRDQGSANAPGAPTSEATDAGLLLTLELDVLDSGVDPQTEVVHDPRDAFMTSPDKKLQQSMHDTFRTAAAALSRRIEDRGVGQAMTGAESGDSAAGLNLSQLSGRWRMFESWNPTGSEDTLRKRLESCGGISGAGAAIRGWMDALQGKYPDRDLIVIAGVDHAAQALTGLGSTGPGEKLFEKTQAVARCNEQPDLADPVKAKGRINAINTIVVGSESDAREVWRGLGDREGIRVVIFNAAEASLFQRDGGRVTLRLPEGPAPGHQP